MDRAIADGPDLMADHRRDLRDRQAPIRLDRGRDLGGVFALQLSVHPLRASGRDRCSCGVIRDPRGWLFLARVGRGRIMGISSRGGSRWIVALRQAGTRIFSAPILRRARSNPATAENAVEIRQERSADHADRAGGLVVWLL